MKDSSLDAAARAALIDVLFQKFREHYIDADRAAQVESAIRARLAAGMYDQSSVPDTFCELLTQHLQEISCDKHVRLRYSTQPLPVANTSSPRHGLDQGFVRFLRQRNFGFHKIERLVGQIGYIDLRGFAPPALGGELAIAAMTLVAHTEALLFDLRQCRGGDAGMVALLSSYLFEQPVHLNSMYWRDTDRLRQYWTLPYVPGPRYCDQPVYVLTSGYTFSAAEEFAYNLQQLKRATIVGEVTGGGAHPTDAFTLSPHYVAHIPTGRSINPITTTNWEGIGVQPDIAVAAEEALQTAHRLALNSILQRDRDATADADLLNEVREALASLEDSAERAK